MNAKRGRPPKPKGDVRETPLTVRLLGGEKRACARSARRAGMKLSDWVRSILLSACEKDR